MIYLVQRSAGVVGMTKDEFDEYRNVFDHRTLDIKYEMAFPVDAHVCEAMVDLEEAPEVPLD